MQASSVFAWRLRAVVPSRNGRPVRAVIAESARLPELRQRTFEFGTCLCLERSGVTSSGERSGNRDVNGYDVAAAQFLGMVAVVVFWPRLVHGTGRSRMKRRCAQSTRPLRRSSPATPEDERHSVRTRRHEYAGKVATGQIRSGPSVAAPWCRAARRPFSSSHARGSVIQSPCRHADRLPSIRRLLGDEPEWPAR